MKAMKDVALSAKNIVRRFKESKAKRYQWESHWRDCYDYALPQRGVFNDATVGGGRRTGHLYDGTACDAVEQLAASMMAHMTPSWSRWFGLIEGRYRRRHFESSVADMLEDTSATLQSHFDRSNFAMAMHQCYLDLVTAGTACLMFEQKALGGSSSFHFTCVPLSDVVCEESAEGHLDVTLRRRLVDVRALRRRYPTLVLPPKAHQQGRADGSWRVSVIDMVSPRDKGDGYDYVAVFEDLEGGQGGVIEHALFYESPFINFRWLKAPGEVYGRSPVMKALPDIKTANKVVELILKNASIAVTGIWQAEDDGVLNPSNIRLVPGMIIHKAVGSRGLTPLEAPGRFDVSQLVLKDLRERIRQALIVDRLGPPQQSKMTATEVLERSADLSRLLGATYGRLQNELMAPLIKRGLGILRRMGVIEEVRIDGHVVDVEYHAPLARAQRRADAHNVMVWLDAVSALGGDAMAGVDMAGIMRWLGEKLGVPRDLLETRAHALAHVAQDVVHMALSADAMADKNHGGDHGGDHRRDEE